MLYQKARIILPSTSPEKFRGADGMEIWVRVQPPIKLAVSSAGKQCKDAYVLDRDSTDRYRVAVWGYTDGAGFAGVTRDIVELMPEFREQSDGETDEQQDRIHPDPAD